MKVVKWLDFCLEMSKGFCLVFTAREKQSVVSKRIFFFLYLQRLVRFFLQNTSSAYVKTREQAALKVVLQNKFKINIKLVRV